MRRLVCPVVLLALASACSRNLDVPTRDRLAISPAFASVAPREALVFTAAGGAGGYRFEFSQGGRLSGGDAAVGEVSGSYRAGGAGSAQDVVRVVDAAGGVAEARVTVTAHLAALPGEAFLSPGGALTPALSGGRLPYGFSLARGAGSTATLVAGTYVAGDEGDVVDHIAVSDGTGDPAASTTITVHVGPRVRVHPPAATVAPGEALAFVGLGGSPPLTFGIQSASGATVSPTGAYVAGATGGVVDRVTVTDGNGRVAVAEVTVGAALRLTASGGALRPGITTPLRATGGKGPYRFAFAPRGNRSLGAIVEQTGAYVPGQNVGASDRVVVTDAVGKTATLDLPAVGGLQVHVGPGAARCIGADLNGDGRGDVVVIAQDAQHGFLAARSLSLPAGSGALEAIIHLPSGRVRDRVLVADFNGTGRDQLVFFGPNGLWSLVPDAAGNLVFGPSLPASAFPGGGSFEPAALARGASVNRIVTGRLCNGGTGVYRVDWTVGASSPDPVPVCQSLAVTTAGGVVVVSMASGDLNGDGLPDLAWLESAPGFVRSEGPVRIALGSWSGGFGASVLSYPLRRTAALSVSQWGSSESTLHATPLGLWLIVTPLDGSPAVLDLLRAGSGGTNPAWAAGFPVANAGGPFAGFAPRDATGRRLGAWTVDGQLSFVDLDPAGVPTVVASDAASPDRCLAFSDLNGDGLPDLVAGDATASTSDVLFGDGGTSYGRRAWFARDGAYAALGDLDGDQLGDVIVASGDRSVRVLFGGGGQLAYGPETALPQPVVGLAAGDLGGARPSAAVLDQSGALTVLGLDAEGAVSSSAALQPLDLSLWVPIRVQVHDFGGSAPGGDVLVATENGDRNSSAVYQAQVRHRDAGGATDRAGTDLLMGNVRGFRWCEILAAGAGADAEAVALCLANTRASALLYRAPMVKGAWVAPWSAVPAPALDGTGPNASLVAAGTLPTGEAVFVASPGVATGSPLVYAVTVAAGGGVTVSQLAGLSGPVTGAVLGEIRAGQQDLVVAAGGVVQTFLGAGSGNYAASATSAVAPGVPATILPLRTPGTSDVLFATPDAFVPLAGDGAGDLR